MFQVFKEKLPFGSLFKTIFPFAFCQDDRRVPMLLAPGHNRTAPEPSIICMLWETPGETWRRNFALIVDVKRCGRLVINNKRKIGFILQKHQKGKK